MTTSKILRIESALKLHINYNGISSNGKYLRLMDELAYNYKGAPGVRPCLLLDDYFKAVNVKNLDEALKRIKKLYG